MILRILTIITNMKKIIKLISKLFPKEKRVQIAMEIMDKAIEKGKDKLDEMVINGKDVKREHLDQLEEMLKYYLTK